jgi:hypothetical protein
MAFKVLEGFEEMKRFDLVIKISLSSVKHRGLRRTLQGANTKTALH